LHQQSIYSDTSYCQVTSFGGPRCRPALVYAAQNGGVNFLDDSFERVAADALAQTGSASAVIFVGGGLGELVLAGAAGVEGEPLDRLVEAVKSPAHPVTHTASRGRPEFDVKPMAPGGPALRTHVPLRDMSGSGKTIGVLALAHQAPLTAEQRGAAQDLAGRAADLAAAKEGT
jgi:hypothetical protein